MDKRKELILNTIIKEHIETGTPVGSTVIVEKYKLGISPATVRNDMSFLEEEGFIIQPHTSAGRIPTEKAFSFYLNNLSGADGDEDNQKLGSSEKSLINKALESRDELSLKKTAKILAQISGNAVFWAFHKHNLYYTGISNLLAQPEFTETRMVYDISVIIDRVDEIIDNIFDDIDKGTKIFLGSENPFGDFCGTVLAKYKLGDQVGLFGVLGPMRMDYMKNIALVNYISEKVVND